jgi:23S rRNA pseudouridine955/2504/2580 synthase
MIAERKTGLRNSGLRPGGGANSIVRISGKGRLLVKRSAAAPHLDRRRTHPYDKAVAFIKRRFIVGPDDDGKRVDKVIRTILPRMALPAIYKLIRAGDARLNGAKTRSEARVTGGDELVIRLCEAEPVRGEASEAAGIASHGDPEAYRRAETFRALVVYENRDIALVNKPRGILSHGPGGLDELAAAYYADAVRGSLAFAPAPLHRLDRNTSGLLAVSASLEGARRFSRGLREGLIVKTYLALLLGNAPDLDLWEDRLARDGNSRMSGLAAEAEPGRYARSELFTLARAELGRGRTLSLVQITIRTGRTHQIRAQARARALPLYGDVKYGGGEAPGGYVLHAWRMSIDGSLELGTPPSIVAPLPLAAEASVVRHFGPGWAEASRR